MWSAVQSNTCLCSWRIYISRGLQENVVYLCWPIAPSYSIRVQMRGDGGIVGSQPMSTAVHITWHGAQINFGDLTPYFTTYFVTRISSFSQVKNLYGAGNMSSLKRDTSPTPHRPGRVWHYSVFRQAPLDGWFAQPTTKPSTGWRMVGDDAALAKAAGLKNWHDCIKHVGWNVKHCI